MSAATTTNLASRLSTLSDANKTTLQLINRLAKLNFQPGSTPLNSESGDVRLELSDDIHGSLKQQEEEFELIKQEADDVTAVSNTQSRRRDSDKEREQTRITVLVARLGEDLRLARSQFRKAQLLAKKNSELAKQKERELLFAGIQEGRNTPTSDRRRGQKGLSEEDILADASGDVTTALRRLQQSMRVELERSHYAQETLDESTRALRDLGEHYNSLDDLLTNSRTLLRTLIQSQKSDTWYLETALYILVATIIWLIYRRWLYGPLWWIVWLPFKLAFKLLFWVLSTVGLRSTPSGSFHSTQISETLKIQPSATDRPPARPKMNSQVRVGGGGRGAPIEHNQPPQDPSEDGSLSQEVGQMAEKSQKEPEKEQIARGDGTLLRERADDEPVNPKKRVMDTEGEKKVYKRDEL